MSEYIVSLDDFGQPDFECEAKLSESFLFPNPLKPDALSPRTIFLTGSTGLLGVFLLEEWLRTTPATVICLIRAEDDASAQLRIIAHLKAYGLWNESFTDRVIGLAGDISLPSFGWSEDIFRQRAEQVDLICHSAGSINMSLPYNRLKPINVNGVMEAMRMAGTGYTKPFHFISSIAVFYSDAHPASRVLYESDVPFYHPSIKGDYGKSKWVADRLVAKAQQRGLPAVIYRPTRIMGHSQTGALNDTTEILPQLIRACLLMGCYPDWDIEITWVPVDYISRSVIALTANREAWGKSLHFFNQAPIKWCELMQHFKACGYPLTQTRYDDWRQEVKKRTVKGLPEREFFAGILLAFTGLHYLFHNRPKFDNAELIRLLEGKGIHCPQIDRQMIEAYTRYWQQRGFIPLP